MRKPYRVKNNLIGKTNKTILPNGHPHTLCK